MFEFDIVLYEDIEDKILVKNYLKYVIKFDY